jgi:hypothetical protein
MQLNLTLKTQQKTEKQKQTNIEKHVLHPQHIYIYNCSTASIARATLESTLLDSFVFFSTFPAFIRNLFSRG